MCSGPLAAPGFKFPVYCGFCPPYTETVSVREGGSGSQATGIRKCVTCGAEFGVRVDVFLMLPPGCGTEAGYERHRRKGEPACDRCRQAHVERTGEGKKRRKAERARMAVVGS